MPLYETESMFCHSDIWHHGCHMCRLSNFPNLYSSCTAIVSWVPESACHMLLPHSFCCRLQLEIFMFLGIFAQVTAGMIQPPSKRPPPPAQCREASASPSPICRGRKSQSLPSDLVVPVSFKRVLNENFQDYGRIPIDDLRPGTEVEFWHSDEERVRMHNMRCMSNHPLYKMGPNEIEDTCAEVRLYSHDNSFIVHVGAGSRWCAVIDRSKPSSLFDNSWALRFPPDGHTESNIMRFDVEKQRQAAKCEKNKFKRIKKQTNANTAIGCSDDTATEAQS